MLSEEAQLESELSDISDEQLIADICRSSFYEFFLEFWETIETVELVPNWHINYLCDQLQEIMQAWERGESQPDTLINIPPGTSKSTTVTQLFPAWVWVRCPSFRMISSSYAADLSMSHAIKSRDCVKSDKFQKIFPGLIDFKNDEDGKKAYRNTKMGQRFSTSTGGRVTGMHGDGILIDDPIDPEQASGAKVRLKAAGHLRKLSTRKTNKDRSFTILLMQRVHELDPAGIWLASGEPLRHICLPGELTTDPATGIYGGNVKPASLITRYVDGLLDVLRLGRSALARLKVALGSYGYSGQILQRPSPAEGGLIKKKWFRSISWANFLETVPGAKTAVWHGDADTAFTEKQQNDPTGLLISAYLQNTLYVRRVEELRLEMPELIVALPQKVKDNGFGVLSKLYIEPKASGLSTMQLLKRTTKLNVIAAPAPTADKTARVNDSTPFIESGRVVIIEGGGGEQLIEQAANFPNAAHDDLLDCLTQSIARNSAERRGTSAA